MLVLSTLEGSHEWTMMQFTENDEESRLGTIHLLQSSRRKVRALNSRLQSRRRSQSRGSQEDRVEAGQLKLFSHSG